MKVVILAGGRGTRISEESNLKPKPMIEIGEKPVLWHIMKIYSHYGYNDFIICLGYKGYVIKEYFANYFLHQADVTISIENNKMKIHKSKSEPWKITLVDTGLETMTGGRLKRIKEYVENENFMMTYGDGVSDVDLNRLVKFHKKNGRMATITAVQPIGRFGALKIDNNDNVIEFNEKPKGDDVWINGGYFVLTPKVFDYIASDETIFEKEPLREISKIGQMSAYKHSGFWQPMDTLRDKNYLDELWNTGNAPWKTWK
ncbi:MAG: glucose-1-phosphate cytidylyltransferase [Candidatus Firestonebacteria bacterium RIFOXYA2_FULL_40_8]|nr:MAG: glucose-1-phosphate cytidylyltransferase [Candidatus Firestonebacteria bacterium RIFOXYA2_FULL_40_8]